MKYTSVLAIAITSVVAQSYIPDGVSSGCSTFMTSMNSNSDLATCTNSLVAATSAFQSASSNATSTDVSSALDKLCSNSCSSAQVQSLLSQFYSACGDDMASNDQVKKAYDLLYVLIPFSNAACTKNAQTNAYCAISMNSNSAASSNSKRDVTLQARAANATTPSKNATTVSTSGPQADTASMQTSGAPYLFLTANTDASALCTPCGKAVLNSYASFEAQLQYALGIAQSPILGGQSQLWSHASSVCGADFVSSVVSNVQGAGPQGGLGQNAAAAGMTKNTIAAIVLAAFAGMLMV